MSKKSRYEELEIGNSRKIVKRMRIRPDAIEKENKRNRRDRFDRRNYNYDDNRITARFINSNG